ncbi:hypothetical protein XENTR_v10008971 [Xenopus tropicalis]|uniref:Neuromedin B n=1 Tax=Xenopus tropicalis TaxID=8364 RepID=A0A6I8QFN4_XENTR|nr:neuromedin-B isoform X1 [Xenopus tropicalis]KAE8617059.1 hypothetical protein XENTR_v10008971 [Xenopus tropicalis]
MSAVPLTRMLPLGFLAHLLLFSFIPLSFCMDFSEDTGKLDKFSLLHRRGNQWAIGHFMGKKSLRDTYNLGKQDMESEDFHPKTMESMRGTFFREPLRSLLPSQREEAQQLLKKIMDHYIKTSQK